MTAPVESTASPLTASEPMTTAYFSMEIAVSSDMPTYSGGLGVLAGDTLWSAADLGLPVVAVTLAHRKGYFHQSIAPDGTQSERDDVWSPEEMLEARRPIVTVEIGGRAVYVRGFVKTIEGVDGHRVPIVFLDTALPENSDYDKKLTDHLYGGDHAYRLAQEIVLGIAGVKMLRALGYDSRVQFHMNEGHSALLTLALVEEQLHGNECPEKPATLIDHTRRRCVFTTHTPVPAGHDSFPEDLVVEFLGETRTESLRRLGVLEDGTLNMTHVALRLSRTTNAVAMRHGEVSREMFPDFEIRAITNGVHAGRWVAPPVAALLDRRVPGWRRDNSDLRHAIALPLAELRAAHAEAKAGLLAKVRERTDRPFHDDHFTIAFARRAAEYKRPDFLFRDIERLRAIAAQHPIQILFAGKAHPRDEGGKSRIRRVVEAANALHGRISVAWLEDYEMELAKWLVAGADIWLNTPTKPHEASGTSGMKAALNGVPSLSTLDGWWVEGCIEGVTGWSIGTPPPDGSDDAVEAASMYDKLERAILPLYYESPDGYAEVRRAAIAFNGSFFNTHRMVLQYARNAYAS